MMWCVVSESTYQTHWNDEDSTRFNFKKQASNELRWFIQFFYFNDVAFFSIIHVSMFGLELKSMPSSSSLSSKVSEFSSII